jgi:hypothetical protein
MHLPTSNQDRPRSPRTIAALEAGLSRALSALPLPATLVLAAAAYGAVALVLPLTTGTNGVPLLLCNVIGALLGLSLALARLYPAGESRVAHLLEWTQDLGDLVPDD